MRSSKYFMLVLFVCVFVHCECDPVFAPGEHIPTRVSSEDNGHFPNAIDDVTSFLRSWFSHLRKRMFQVLEDTDNVPDSVSHDIHKRHIKLPINFEDLEREYMINETAKYLNQFFGYAKYINTDSEIRTELDQICANELQRILAMSAEQLNDYMSTLKSALNLGIGHGHTIRVKGHTYSLDNVGSWCCPF